MTGSWELSEAEVWRQTAEDWKFMYLRTLEQLEAARSYLADKNAEALRPLCSRCTAERLTGCAAPSSCHARVSAVSYE